MTGSTQEAAEINNTLATQPRRRCRYGVRSQRVALEHPEMAYSFQVRKIAPDTLLLANLGAIQLNYGYGISHCQRAVDMIEADALILPNALQEALQPEGDTCFSGLSIRLKWYVNHFCSGNCERSWMGIFTRGYTPIGRCWRVCD
jgi:isopentenyl-diphosphate delta-isomerase